MLRVPPEILTQIQRPPLLKGESLQDYNDFFTGLATDIGPVDRMEWLWVVQFVDCSWEILRNRRFRANLIDLQSRPALRGVILKATPQSLLPGELESECRRLVEDPSQFAAKGIDPGSVSALGFVQIGPNLEIIDKSLERLQRRCDSILQQLEARREVFAHRARVAAEKVLEAENVKVPHIESADAPLATEAADQPSDGDGSGGAQASSPESVPPNSEPASSEATTQVAPSSES